jgi:hypothetical protein
MNPWHNKPGILQLRAYACEVIVSLLVHGKDMKQDSVDLMNQWSFGDEAGFRKAAMKILNQVLS